MLQERFEVSERRACRVASQHRSTQRRRAMPLPDEVHLVREMRDLASANPRYGSRRIHRLLCRDGWRVNHKRVERLWRLEGLQVPLRSVARCRMEFRNLGDSSWYVYIS